MTSTSDRSSTSAEVEVEVEVEVHLDRIHRAEWGRLVSMLLARTRRLDLVDDAVAEAFARAAAGWSIDGIPSNPAGWLYTAAHRHVIGRLRAEAVAARHAPLLAVRQGDTAPQDGFDERLHLVLLCCHPALAEASRPALALRLVIGTPTEQIARLFLVSTATMAARITRAKHKIVAAGIPLGAPAAAELAARMDAVCRTIYLAFTAGYTPRTGPDLLRTDLADEAVRLAGLVHELAPSAPQAQATFALVTLQHSRRDARRRDGRLVTLAHQDRSVWRHDEIDAAIAVVDGIVPTDGHAEDLRLQALIAAEHARASTARDTDWARIASLYAALEIRTGSPIVRLNRAVAVAEASGPAAGLSVLVGLDGALADDHRLASVRADLLRRADRLDEARVAYRTAIAQCTNHVERDHLLERSAELDDHVVRLVGGPSSGTDSGVARQHTQESR